MAPTLKSVVSLVVPLLLLMALLAVSVTAGGAGGFQPDADGQYCGQVRVCKEELCSAMCAVVGIAGVGQCKVVDDVPTCCCVPTTPSASTVGVQTSGDHHQLLH